MCTKTVARIIGGRKRRSPPPAPYDPFMRLIAEWYNRYPSLMAFQIYERLKSYGYTGSYRSICRATEKYRKKHQKVYHELTFLPGEEAQVDWMEAKLPFGRVYGFVFILPVSLREVLSSCIYGVLFRRPYGGFLRDRRHCTETPVR
jgi:hypothetical protein